MDEADRKLELIYKSLSEEMRLRIRITQLALGVKIAFFSGAFAYTFSRGTASQSETIMLVLVPFVLLCCDSYIIYNHRLIDSNGRYVEHHILQVWRRTLRKRYKDWITWHQHLEQEKQNVWDYLGRAHVLLTLLTIAFVAYIVFQEDHKKIIMIGATIGSFVWFMLNSYFLWQECSHH